MSLSLATNSCLVVSFRVVVVFSAASIFIFKAPKKCSAIRIIQFRQQYRKPKKSHCKLNNNNYADQLMGTDTGLGCWRSFCITGLVMGGSSMESDQFNCFSINLFTLWPLCGRRASDDLSRQEECRG